MKINKLRCGVKLFGLCCSVLSFVGISNGQGVQQNTIDFSNAIPNAQGLYFCILIEAVMKKDILLLYGVLTV